MIKINQVLRHAFCILLFLTFLFSCSKPVDIKLFQIESPNKTSVDFKNIVIENDSINILEYLSAYNGAGIAAGDFNNDGLIDLYFVANQKPNKLYFNQGDFQFEDVTVKAGVEGLSGEKTWSNGVTIVDINQDGWLDLYICMMHGYLGIEGKNQLFINNKDGTFRELANEYGLDFSTYSQHAAFFDYDNDGDLDMYLLNQAVHTKLSFSPAVNRDLRDLMAGDKFLQNNQGKFTDVSEEVGIYGGPMGYGLAVSTGDINNDGWQDIYVSNDFHENDYLYYNQGDGTFKEGVCQSTGHLSKSSMGNDIGDYDNDGDLDIMTLDMKAPNEIIAKQTSGIDPYPVYQYKLGFGYHYQFSRNMLQQNQGNLFDSKNVHFSELGELMGVSGTDWSWSVLMADMDNNGYKDLIITNGIPKRPNSLDYRKLVNENTKRAEATPSEELVAIMPEGMSGNFAFQNTGDRFLDVSADWGLDFKAYSNGAILADLDNDGDLDVAMNNLNANATIYRNQTSEITNHHYLKILLMKNGEKYYWPGTRVEVKNETQSQLQEIKSTSGWLSSTVGPLNFGLNTNSSAVTINVKWTDGKEQTLIQNILDTAIVVNYEDSSHPELSDATKSEKLFIDVSDSSGIDFQFEEDEYIDFHSEPLIPFFLSTQGPKISVGDVNGDGIDDFYIGGSRKQKGEICLGVNDGNVKFRKGNNSVFEQHRYSEDIGSALADVDNDGDLDLYVAGGGGESGNGQLFRDRMYFNDGKGNFSFHAEAIPPLNNNSSCVVPLDVNSDGFIDFFIGSRSVPGRYGFSGKSIILVNDGHGQFLDETNTYLENQGRIGMITDAIWISDRKELIVTGQWMPIRIYSFGAEQITHQDIPDSEGWWNSITASDLDDDGDIDLIAGNLGLNTDLHASIDQPIDLYIKDFDGNHSIEPIMTYYRNGRQWIYPGLDDLIQQMPALGNIFPVYHIFANKKFEEIFPPNMLQGSMHLQAKLMASIILENRVEGYKIHELPLMAQSSPIFGIVADDFDKDGVKDILAVGNIFDTQPGIGKLDASFGTFLKGEGNLEFEYITPLKSGFAIKGEARDIKIIQNSAENRLILISRNDSTVCLFK